MTMVCEVKLVDLNIDLIRRMYLLFLLLIRFDVQYVLLSWWYFYCWVGDIFILEPCILFL